jgi:serine/threonine-protein kinase
MAFSAGDLIDERYWIMGRLGAGGHGEVFQAEDRQLGSQVAIKCLHPEVMADPEFQTRIQREARVMGSLSGTSAVQILAFNKAADGSAYIVMELLQGCDLETYLYSIESREIRLPSAALFELLEPIVDTLELAHARRILHRDIKPANIFVLASRARGVVRLLDFGIAKDMNAAPLTQEGVVNGSPHYVAPESWRGRSKELDQRVDVFGLGVVIYRILAGQVPFPSGDLIDIVAANTRSPRPSLRAIRPDLPSEVDAWVAKALAINPAERFPDVRSLWTSLQEVLGQRGPAA